MLGTNPVERASNAALAVWIATWIAGGLLIIIGWGELAISLIATGVGAIGYGFGVLRGAVIAFRECRLSVIAEYDRGLR